MKVKAPFPQSNNYVAWGVLWIDGIADVNEQLGEKLIGKGYTRLEEKQKKKKDKE